jgi:hypothetical protein
MRRSFPAGVHRAGASRTCHPGRYAALTSPDPIHNFRSYLERMAENFDVFDFQLTDEEMGRIAALDTGASLVFDHRDPAMVSQIDNAHRT